MIRLGSSTLTACDGLAPAQHGAAQNTPLPVILELRGELPATVPAQAVELKPHPPPIVRLIRTSGYPAIVSVFSPSGVTNPRRTPLR